MAQRQAEELQRERVCSEQFGPARTVGGRSSCIVCAPASQLDIGAFSKMPQSLEKIHLVIVDDKVQRVAPGAARKTVVNLLGGDDVHRRFMIVVERADADKFAPLCLESDMFANKLNNVSCFEHELAIIGLQSSSYGSRRLRKRPTRLQMVQARTRPAGALERALDVQRLHTGIVFVVEEGRGPDDHRCSRLAGIRT